MKGFLSSQSEGYYNFMQLQVSILIFLYAVLVRPFEIFYGGSELVPQYLQFDDVNLSQPSIPISNSIVKAEKIDFIYPYEIYRFKSKYSFEYLFCKLHYDSVQDFFEFENRSLKSIDEFKYLYQKLPIVIKIEPSLYENIELIKINQPSHRKTLIIKNFSSINADEYYDLNVYSLHLHKYLFLKIQSLKKESGYKRPQNKTQWNSNTIGNHYKQMKDEDPQKQVLNDLDELIDLRQQKSVNSKGFLQYDFHKRLDKNTIWRVKYNQTVFHFIFANTTKLIKQEKNRNQQSLAAAHFEDFQQQSQITIELYKLQKNHLITKFKIKQLSSQLGMENISFVDICSGQGRDLMMLSDLKKIYIIDVTEKQWHLSYFKQIANHSVTYFTKNCNLISNLSKTATVTSILIKEKYLAVNKNQCIYNFTQQLVHFNSINENYFVVCYNTSCEIIKQNCEILQTNISNGNQLNTIWKFHQQYKNGSINTIGEIIKPNSNHSNFLMNSDNMLVKNESIFSKFYRSIYNFKVYQEEKLYRNSEMDEIIWEKLSLTNSQFSLYHKFVKTLELAGSACDQKIQNEIDKKLRLNETFEWSICSVGVSINSYTSVTLQIQSTQSAYDIYICAASFKNIEDANGKIQCQQYFKYRKQIPKQTVSESITVYLNSNNYFRFYFIRHLKDEARKTNNHTVILSLRDIDKQQLQYATSVFFVIMLSLAVILFLLICIVMLRPVIISMLVYFGIMRNQREDSYPLSFFALKIRLKKFRKDGYLQYEKRKGFNSSQELNETNEGKETDDQLLCCFCLQEIKTGNKVARLYCNHQFHAECFNEWTKNQPNMKCPSCRREFTPKALNDFKRNEIELVKESDTV